AFTLKVTRIANGCFSSLIFDLISFTTGVSSSAACTDADEVITSAANGSASIKARNIGESPMWKLSSATNSCCLSSCIRRQSSAHLLGKDSTMRSLHVAVLDEELPFPLTSGKRIRTFNLLARLAKRHRVTVLCHKNPNRDETFAAEDAFRDAGI